MATNFYPLNIPNIRSTHSVANSIELYITVNKRSISKAELISEFEALSGEEPEPRLIDDVWLEMQMRERLYGQTPPFTVFDREIECAIQWEEKPEYLTCVLLDLVGNRENVNITGKLFEMLSGAAIQNYLGGSFVIYGFPRGSNTLNDIAQRLSERLQSQLPKHRKDRGVDIIAWKSFDDNRSSQVVVLLQCASGRNWRNKLREVNLDAWGQYIHWANRPVKGFAMPTILEKEDFHDVCVDAGLMLDRTRIYRYTSCIGIADTSLRPKLVKWCKRKLKTIIE